MRRNDIAGWARRTRPHTRKSHGYAATWYEPKGEERRRPKNTKEATIGAAQECEKLIQRPINKWSHNLIIQYIDEYGRTRETLNATTACMAPPGSSDRRVGPECMGSPDSGYSIIYWESGTVQVTPDENVKIWEYVVRKQEGTWKVILPKPKKGATGQIISIRKEDPHEWHIQT